MGRARGSALLSAPALRSAAEGTDRFQALFGGGRGGSERYFFERSNVPSSGARRLLAVYEAHLERGNLGPTVELLREHAALIESAPRLEDLRAMLADRLLVEARQHYEPARLRLYATFAANPVLENRSEVALSRAVAASTYATLTRVPRAAKRTLAPESAPTVEEMLRGMTRSAYVDASHKAFLRVVAPGGHVSEKCIRFVLGERAYRRLAQEVGGGERWPLQKLFDKEVVLVEGHPEFKLGGFMQRTQWRDYTHLLTCDWLRSDDENSWQNCVRYEAPEPTVGIRGEARYKLARILRKRMRMPPRA